MLRPASNPSSDVEGKIIPFNPNASQHNAFKDELNPRVLANIGPNLLAKFAMTMEGLQGPFVRIGLSWIQCCPWRNPKLSSQLAIAKHVCNDIGNVKRAHHSFVIDLNLMRWT